MGANGDQKLLAALRNAFAWLQTAANLARLAGRDNIADALVNEAKAVMALTETAATGRP